MYAKNFPEYITRDYISLYRVLSYRNLATWKIGSSFEYNGRATFFARCKTQSAVIFSSLSFISKIYYA